MRQIRDRLTDQSGQTLILFVAALPLLLALIALVTDGSNLFANKRSVQNVADATALAVARDLPSDGTACAGMCLATMQSDAITYSNLNKGPTVDHACASGTDVNCYQTPYKGNSSVQIRVKRQVSTFFGGVTGLFNSSVVASAAVSLGGVPSAAGAVTPIGVDKANVCLNGDTACFNALHTLDFQSSPGYSLLDLSQVSTSTPVAGTNPGTTLMNTWVNQGYPGLLPANAWYGAVADLGGHNGMRSSFQTAQTSGQVLLVPVFGVPPAGTQSPDPTTGAYWVVGFAAFVIDPTWDLVANWKGNSGNDKNPGIHMLRGHFVDFISSGVSGGPPGGPNDFGVHVITLDE